MRSSLKGYAAAVLEVAAADGSLALVADELGQVAHLAESMPDLSAALTDTGIPVASRRAVIHDLLAARVLGSSLRIVERAVSEEPAQLLVMSLHQLAEYSRLQAERGLAEVESEEPDLSRAAARNMASGYAAGVLESVASVQEMEEVEDELFRFTRVVESNPALIAALADRAVPVATRQALVTGLLAGKAMPATVRLATGCLRTRGRDVVAHLDWLVEQTAIARGWRVAKVSAARPIDADEQQSLSDALARLTGRPVELQISFDKELLGGAVVQVGDLLVDASAKHKLDSLAEHLLLGAEEARRGADN